MENASKALLIAGTILISVLMLSVAIILYNNFSDATKEYSTTLSATELAKFNTKFEVFRGRTNVKAQEIVSLINEVAEYKKKTPMNVVVKVNNDVIDNTIKFLEENLNKDYSCEEIAYNSASEVKQICFNDNTHGGGNPNIPGSENPNIQGGEYFNTYIERHFTNTSNIARAEVKNFISAIKNFENVYNLSLRIRESARNRYERFRVEKRRI